jgi:hypothetical protein
MCRLVLLAKSLGFLDERLLLGVAEESAKRMYMSDAAMPQVNDLRGAALYLCRLHPQIFGSVNATRLLVYFESIGKVRQVKRECGRLERHKARVNCFFAVFSMSASQKLLCVARAQFSSRICYPKKAIKLSINTAPNASARAASKTSMASVRIQFMPVFNTDRLSGGRI